MAENLNKSVGFILKKSLEGVNLAAGSFYWIKQSTDENYPNGLYFAVTGGTSGKTIRLDLDPDKLLKTVETNGQGTITFKNGDSDTIDTVDITNDVRYIVTNVVGDLNKVMSFKGVIAPGEFPEDASIGDIVLDTEGNEWIYAGIQGENSDFYDTDSDGEPGWTKFGDQNGIKSILESIGNIDIENGGDKYINVTGSVSEGFVITLNNVATDLDYSQSDYGRITVTEGSNDKLVRLGDLDKVVDKVSDLIEATSNYSGIYKSSDSDFITIGEIEPETNKQSVGLVYGTFNADSDGTFDKDGTYTDGLAKVSSVAEIIKANEKATETAISGLDTRIDTIEANTASDGAMTYNDAPDSTTESVTVKVGEEDKWVTTQQVADLVNEVVEDITNDISNTIVNDLSWQEF